MCVKLTPQSGHETAPAFLLSLLTHTPHRVCAQDRIYGTLLDLPSPEPEYNKHLVNIYTTLSNSSQKRVCVKFLTYGKLPSTVTTHQIGARHDLIRKKQSSPLLLLNLRHVRCTLISAHRKQRLVPDSTLTRLLVSRLWRMGLSRISRSNVLELMRVSTLALLGSTIDNVLCLSSITNVLCLSSITNVLCLSSIANVLCLSSITNVLCLSSITNVLCLSSIANVLCLSSIANVLCLSSITNVLCLSSITNVLCLSSIANVLCLSSIANVLCLSFLCR